MAWGKSEKLSRADIQRLVKKLTNAAPHDGNSGKDVYGKTPLLTIAAKEEVASVRDTISKLNSMILSQGVLIDRLIALTPEAFVVTKFKSSKRPPDELFKVVNKITNKCAYGETEEEARRKVC